MAGLPMIALLLTGLLAGVGVIQALAAAALVARFSRRRPRDPSRHPPITVLKPLHGDEPWLEEALASTCTQDYPVYQIVFGVSDPADTAVAVVERVRRRCPDADISLVVSADTHGRNHKIGNVINMLPAAKHDVLVIADSDVHVRRDYLDRLAAALEPDGVGLVTMLYAGLPASARRPALLGALQITHGFLPGALLSRALGRSDCLGATMGLRRSDLARIGGLESLVDHLADDNVLGRRIQRLGLRVALAEAVVLTTVPEAALGALFTHELRWARTIRTLEPAGFAASVLQYPLFWGMLAVPASGLAWWSVAILAVAWLLRAGSVLWVDRSLRRFWAGDYRWVLAFSSRLWLLPVRDVLSVLVMLASYAGRRVDWRGHALHADSPARSLDKRAPDAHRPGSGSTEDTRQR